MTFSHRLPIIIIICVVCLLILVVEYCPNTVIAPGQSFGLYNEQAPESASPPSTRHLQQDDNNIQTERIRHLEQSCRNMTSSSTHNYTAPRIIYYISRRYNFSYCKVPKVGSTFLTRVFSILNHGVNSSDIAFERSRASVHATMMDFFVPFSSRLRNATASLLVSRNPYSRLFSAYVDKCYLSLIDNLNVKIDKLKRPHSRDAKMLICPSPVTFSDFLEYILNLERNSAKLNRHWAPIVSICNPCEVRPLAVLKQETYAKDVEYALQKVGVAEIEYDVIVDAMRAHRAEHSIPPIVETIFNHVSNSALVQHCLGWLGVQRKIWTALQIQGFIDNTVPFPLENMTNASPDDTRNPEYITSIILDVIQKHPMTSAKSKVQRQEALEAAYRNVSDATIKGIQELYREDFELFGYNQTPPGR